MHRLYMAMFIVAGVVCAYFYGAGIADSKCKMKMAQNDLNHFQYVQNENIKNERIINETVYKTGVADIRSILRTKYTIEQ